MNSQYSTAAEAAAYHAEKKSVKLTYRGESPSQCVKGFSEQCQSVRKTSKTLSNTTNWRDVRVYSSCSIKWPFYVVPRRSVGARCRKIFLINLFPRVWILSLNERFKWTKICRKSVASFKMVNITFLQYNWCFLLNNLCHFRVWYTNIFFSSLLILVHKPKIYHFNSIELVKYKYLILRCRSKIFQAQ